MGYIKVKLNLGLLLAVAAFCVSEFQNTKCLAARPIEFERASGGGGLVRIPLKITTNAGDEYDDTTELNPVVGETAASATSSVSNTTNVTSAAIANGNGVANVGVPGIPIGTSTNTPGVRTKLFEQFVVTGEAEAETAFGPAPNHVVSVGTFNGIVLEPTPDALLHGSIYLYARRTVTDEDEVTDVPSVSGIVNGGNAFAQWAGDSWHVVANLPDGTTVETNLDSVNNFFDFTIPINTEAFSLQLEARSLSKVRVFTSGTEGNTYSIDLIAASVGIVTPLGNVPLTGDFDADGDVDGDDLTRWQSGYASEIGAMLSEGDANKDALVDGRDFLAWQRGFGSTYQLPEESIAQRLPVPEPGSFHLLLVWAAFGFCGRPIIFRRTSAAA